MNRQLIVLALLLTVLAQSVLAANDPGHDSLYVLRLGDTNITGDINLTGSLTASLVRFNNKTFGDYLDINANGTILGAPSAPRIMAGSSVLYIDSTGNLYLNTKGGTTGIVQVGDTATNAVTMNVSGQLVAYNITALNVYSSGGVNASGPIFAGGSQVCTVGNGLCASPGVGGNAGGGWYNTSDNTTSSLRVIVNSSATTGSFIVQNQTGSTHVLVNGSSGYVGVGTATPMVRLHIVHDEGSAAGAGVPVVYLAKSNNFGNSLVDMVHLNRTVSGDVGSAGVGSSLVFSTEDSTGAAESMGRFGAIYTTVTDGSEVSAFVFQTRTGGGAIAEAARLQGQNFGINTTNPQNTLEVKGTLNASAIYVGTTAVCLSNGVNCLASGGDAGSGWLNTSTQVILANNATNVSVGSLSGLSALFVDTARGRVGVNTSTLTAALSVNGTVNITGQNHLSGNTTYSLSTGNSVVCFERFIGTTQNYSRCINSSGHVTENFGSFAVN